MRSASDVSSSEEVIAGTAEDATMARLQKKARKAKAAAARAETAVAAAQAARDAWRKAGAPCHHVNCQPGIGFCLRVSALVHSCLLGDSVLLRHFVQVPPYSISHSHKSQILNSSNC